MKHIVQNIIEKIYLSFNDNLVYYESTTQCKSRFYYDTIICKDYENKECIFAFVDINNLKSINDTYGHCYGTQHIKNIANQLKKLSNIYDICRVGGDEFAIIGNNEFNDNELKCIKGISYGIVHKRKQDTFYDIVQKADQKMYKMKRAMKKA